MIWLSLAVFVSCFIIAALQGRSERRYRQRGGWR